MIEVHNTGDIVAWKENSWLLSAYSMEAIMSRSMKQVECADYEVVK